MRDPKALEEYRPTPIKMAPKVLSILIAVIVGVKREWEEEEDSR